MSAIYFKAGENVKIYNDLVIGNWYGDCKFLKEMEQYKNKTLTILSCENSFGYKYYKLKDIPWSWTDEMLMHAQPSFKVGNKVECINDDYCSLIKKGSIYTVSSISYKLDAIQLEEGINYYYGIEKFKLVDDYCSEKTTECIDVILEKLGLELAEVFEIKNKYNYNCVFLFKKIAHMAS